ncbi:divergent protein kinase domain 2A-like [Glandiceps talaboti]
MARRTRLPITIKLAFFSMLVILCYVCYKIFQFTNISNSSGSTRRSYDGQSRSDILPVLPNYDVFKRPDIVSNDVRPKSMMISQVHEYDDKIFHEISSESNNSKDSLDSDYSDGKITPDQQKTWNPSSIHDYPFEVQKCPACFGDSLCQSFSNGDAMLNISSRYLDDYNMVYSGYYKRSKVIGKRMGSNADFMKLDNFICVNTSQDTNCDVGDAVVMSYLASDEALSVHHFRNELWKITHQSRAALSATICASRRFIDTIKNLYNQDNRGILNEEERAHLMTSLILNPEGLLLKFFMESESTESTIWPLPFYIGECGRIIVVENPGKPLIQFFNDTWEQRVSLSLQLLDLIDKFFKDNSDWLLLFTDFHYSNFAVTESGRVILTKLKDVLIIDKYDNKQFSGVIDNHVNYDRPCNEECFAAFVQKLLKDPTSYCKDIQYYAQMMYALGCRWLLSANLEHKLHSNGDDTIKAYIVNPRKSNSFIFNLYGVYFSTAGLLHSLPGEHEEGINELLDECIHETTPGGRLNAVEELMDLLQEIQYSL